MAAKDKESLQQFPLVKTTMLTDQELQEQVKLAKKSLGQSGVSEDPHSQAARYLQQHRIVEVFQVRNGSHVTLSPVAVCPLVSFTRTYVNTGRNVPYIPRWLVVAATL